MFYLIRNLFDDNGDDSNISGDIVKAFQANCILKDYLPKFRLHNTEHYRQVLITSLQFADHDGIYYTINGERIPGVQTKLNDGELIVFTDEEAETLFTNKTFRYAMRWLKFNGNGSLHETLTGSDSDTRPGRTIRFDVWDTRNDTMHPLTDCNELLFKGKPKIDEFVDYICENRVREPTYSFQSAVKKVISRMNESLNLKYHPILESFPTCAYFHPYYCTNDFLIHIFICIGSVIDDEFPVSFRQLDDEDCNVVVWLPDEPTEGSVTINKLAAFIYYLCSVTSERSEILRNRLYSNSHMQARYPGWKPFRPVDIEQAFTNGHLTKYLDALTSPITYGNIWYYIGEKYMDRICQVNPDFTYRVEADDFTRFSKPAAVIVKYKSNPEVKITCDFEMFDKIKTPCICITYYSETKEKKELPDIAFCIFICAYLGITDEGKKRKILFEDEVMKHEKYQEALACVTSSLEKFKTEVVNDDDENPNYPFKTINRFHNYDDECGMDYMYAVRTQYMKGYLTEIHQSKYHGYGDFMYPEAAWKDKKQYQHCFTELEYYASDEYLFKWNNNKDEKDFFVLYFAEYPEQKPICERIYDKLCDYHNKADVEFPCLEMEIKGLRKLFPEDIECIYPYEENKIVIREAFEYDTIWRQHNPT